LGRTTSQQLYSGNTINNSLNNSGGLQRANSQQQQTGKKLEDKSEQINSFGLDKMKVYGEYKWSKTPNLMQVSDNELISFLFFFLFFVKPLFIVIC
jgi:hypothetical protein